MIHRHPDNMAPVLGHHPSLDGLRGVGALCVVLVHAAYDPFQSFAGWVDVFFVVTGFLTTVSMLEEFRRTGEVNPGSFLRRRVRRLLPAIWAVAVATVVAAAAVTALRGGDVFARAVNDAVSAVTLTYHVVHPVGSEILTGEWPVARPLIQLWAVTVEWHWYLLIAAALPVIIRRGWIRPALVVGGACWVAIAAARGLGHVGPRLMWYQRPDSVLLGVLLGLADSLIGPIRGTRAIRRLHRIAWTALVVAAVTVGTGTVVGRAVGLYAPVNPLGDRPPLEEGLYWGRFGFSLVALCAAVVVWVTVRAPGFAGTRFLAGRRFVALGHRSYAIYLVHVPIGVLLAEAVAGTALDPSRPAGALLLPLYVVLLVASTRAVYRGVEQRFAPMPSRPPVEASRPADR